MSLNPPIRDWRGQVVWLVGASSGIGQAIAHALHEQGAKVRVSARSAAALDAFCAQHAGSMALPLDVTDRQQVREASDRILQSDGRIDLLLYCAAHYHPMRATEFDLTDALRHQRVNVEGTLHALDAVMPAMLRQQHGHISLVASVAGYRGLPQSLAYGPTKAALQHLADTLYLDLHDQGIGVSVINPGFVSTPLTQKNDFEMPALLTPAQAAEATLEGWAQGRYEIHFPKRFTLWLKLLQLLPHRLYFSAVRRVTGV